MIQENEKMHIFFASDDNFALPLTISISSILQNSNDEDYHFFHILDKNISAKNKNKINKLKKIKDFDIEYLEIDDKLFENCPLTKECKHISLQTYYRYIIPILRPNIEKLLYFDCDILVVGSLNELWNTDLSDFYCAAVEEMYEGTTRDATRLGIQSYFNAGILLVNNKKWVNEKISDKLFQATKDLCVCNNLIWQDQDVLNYVFKDNVKWIHPKFNFQQNCYPNYTYTKYTETLVKNAELHPIVIHYNTGTKPWSKGYKCNFKKYEYYREMFKNKLFLSLIILFFKQYIRFFLYIKTEKTAEHKQLIITVLGKNYKTNIT